MKITYLTFIFFLLAGNYLSGQATCYEGKANLLGVASSTATVDSFACVLTALVADEAGATPYKSYSVADYSIAEFKNEADVERYRIARYDSLTNVSPYRIIFWWEYVGDNPFGYCRVSFTYPEHDIHNNCFSDLKIGLIEGKLQARSDSLTASGGLAIGSYTSLEASILDLAVAEVEKVKNCCNAAEPENRCDACLVGDELDQLKAHYYIYEIGVEGQLSYGEASAKPSTDGNQTLKSNNNYNAYVNDVLVYGEVTIDLSAEYQNFLALGDTICDFPVVITDDQILCEIELDGWDNGDRSIINISSNDAGEYYLEISEYTLEDCYLFLDYIIDEYPEVFGYSIDFESDRGQLDEAGGAIPAPPNKSEVIKYCYYTPSGALVYERDYTANSNYRLTEIELAKHTNRAPLNSLHIFKYNTFEYISTNKRGSPEYHTGFYIKEELERLKSEKIKRKTKTLESAYFYEGPEVRDYGIVKNGDQCTVTGYKDAGCSAPRRKCQWEVTSSSEVIKGPEQSVEFGNNVRCGEYETGIDEVCCAMGGRYVREILQRLDELPEVIANELRSDEGKRKLKEIGAIICDVGSEYFGQYESSPWNDLPDALKIYFENSIMRLNEGECGGQPCTLDQIVSRFEEYRDNIPNLIAGWNNVVAVLYGV